MFVRAHLSFCEVDVVGVGLGQSGIVRHRAPESFWVLCALALGWYVCVCVCVCVCQDYAIAGSFRNYLEPLAALFELFVSEDQTQELRLLDSRAQEPRAAVPALGQGPAAFGFHPDAVVAVREIMTIFGHFADWRQVFRVGLWHCVVALAAKALARDVDGIRFVLRETLRMMRGMRREHDLLVVENRSVRGHYEVAREQLVEANRHHSRMCDDWESSNRAHEAPPCNYCSVCFVCARSLAVDSSKWIRFVFGL